MGMRLMSVKVELERCLQHLKALKQIIKNEKLQYQVALRYDVVEAMQHCERARQFLRDGSYD